MRAYSHAKSPKVFTQPRLRACLVVKAFGPSADLKQGYRLVREAAGDFTPRAFYADSGYDSEERHRQCWEE